MAKFKLKISKESKGNIMIEFDLERALAGDKVLTRMANEEVLQIHKFILSDDDCNLIGVIDGCIRSLSSEDLHMSPKPLSGFVNYYQDCISGVYKTKIAADNGSREEVRIACIDLSTHNEGEGLT